MTCKIQFGWTANTDIKSHTYLNDEMALWRALKVASDVRFLWLGRLTKRHHYQALKKVMSCNKLLVVFCLTIDTYEFFNIHVSLEKKMIAWTSHRIHLCFSKVVQMQPNIVITMTSHEHYDVSKHLQPHRVFNRLWNNKGNVKAWPTQRSSSNKKRLFGMR